MATGDRSDGVSDPFADWLVGQGVNPQSEEERSRFFELFVADTTGWDGQQFSLSEDERHWILKCAEILAWLEVYIMSDAEPVYLETLKRLVAEMRPMPSSLNID